MLKPRVLLFLRLVTKSPLTYFPNTCTEFTGAIVIYSSPGKMLLLLKVATDAILLILIIVFTCLKRGEYRCEQQVLQYGTRTKSTSYFCLVSGKFGASLGLFWNPKKSGLLFRVPCTCHAPLPRAGEPCVLTTNATQANLSRSPCSSQCGACGATLGQCYFTCLLER